MGAQSVVFEIIHESLMNKDTELSVSALCEIAGVSRSGYYRWVSAEDARNRREQQDRADFELILTAYNFRGYKKGVLGVNMRLLHMGIVMNPKKIRRLMRKYNLFCPFRKANPYRQMAKALRTSNVAANLLNREFEAHGARAVLLTDITYMRFHDGFLYLSTILDAMIHSDQGCHYTSIQFIRLVNDLGLRQSMSRRGNCWDNAPQESFYGHMKDELADKMARWETFDDAKRDVDDWFDYYNNDRYQWQLAKLSPRQYYHYVTTGEYPLPGTPPKA